MGSTDGLNDGSKEGDSVGSKDGIVDVGSQLGSVEGTKV